ncbi:hypothetical protein TELCIR_15110 [Teladorsagia circumcincta]|uniref:Uncharacterized protein n=1 Tax=Teladorsagia circumcincta TaxID=45464 RepID=A0A2G9U1A8_TELCI|nr:hypothetical protein TELCIR_15110 [Teladorsagia circumcincta]
MTVWKNDKASVNVQLPWSKIGKEGKRGLKKTGKELGRFGKRAGRHNGMEFECERSQYDVVSMDMVFHFFAEV